MRCKRSVSGWRRRRHSDAAHSIRSANAAENRFLLPARFNGARDIALSSASLAPDGSLWVLVCRFWRADDGESLTTDFTVERLNADGTVAEKVLLDGMNLNEEPEFLIGSDGSFLLYTFSNGMLSSFDTAGHLTAQEPLALLNEKFAADSDGQVWFIADAEDGAALQAVGSKSRFRFPVSRTVFLCCAMAQTSRECFI